MKERHTGRPRCRTRNSVLIDQEKIDATDAIFDTSTGTENVDAQLDAIAFRREIIRGIRRVRAAGGLQRV
jgi:deoxyribose-phosphate aldolase